VVSLGENIASFDLKLLVPFDHLLRGTIMALKNLNHTVLTTNIEFCTLMILSCIAAFFFVFDGFATEDSIRYALGFQSIMEKGIRQIATVFNGEMASGYYLLLFYLAKLIGNSISLSGLMNNLNAATSVILQVSMFLFFNSLFSDKKLSFFACLAVLLSPSIWFISHYGQPGLISLTFFMGSLFVYDRITRFRLSDQHSGFLWPFFIILSTIALAIRLDIVLAFGAYFALLYFRRALTVSNFFKTLGVLIIVLFLFLGLYYCAFGYLINPLDSTFSQHIQHRLELKSIIRIIMHNFALWIMSINLLIVFLAGFGFIRSGLTSRLGVLLILWIIPWFVLLCFQGMDISRITAPTIPIIALVAVVYVSSIFKKRRVLALILMLIGAQLTAEVIKYPLINFYAFKREIKGQTLARFPLGFPPVDNYYRQRAISAKQNIANNVINEQDSNIMIIGRGGL
jgi:hypothetical protein